MKLNLEHWPIGKLVDYPNNPRKNEHAVSKMVAAIGEFGFRIPVIAKSDGSVVDGHLRLKAAREMGLEEVPVLLADDLSEAQIKAFRLAVNKSAEWADWDIDLLSLELGDLKALDFDLDLLGFDDLELADLLPAADAALGDGAGESRGGLSDRFGIPPFSVLNAREGWWQDRKRAWISLGIKSELGRGAPIGGAPMPLDRRGGGG